MKKTLFVMALAVALTFMFAAAAFADHSPTFYVEWDCDSTFEGYCTTFGNAGTGSPHQNYLEGTEKCGVCHSVHRAPVYGTAWSTDNSGGLDVADITPEGPAKTAVAGGKYNRQDFDTTANGLRGYNDTQMLLQSSVANSCNYCHILTTIGGDVLYAGKPQYVTEGTGLAGSEWDAGFGHHNACTGCHAVHGVANNYGDPSLWGTYGTFQGPIKSKILKIRAKGSGGAVGSAAAYNWQDETVAIGSVGKAEMIAAGGAYATWASAQTPADYAGTDLVNFAVDRLNVPLFPSPADAIAGLNVRPDASAYDAQSGVFCTFCHVNYGWASEATVNPDGDRGLFQGPWMALAGTVDNVTGTAGLWYTVNSANAYGMPFRNHPVKATSDTYGASFVAAGRSATVPAQVAFANASTCVSCHDAGQNPNRAAQLTCNSAECGVWIQSYPHFTPGYFHFVKSASHVGDAMDNGPYECLGIPNKLACDDTAGLAIVQAWLEDPVSYEEATSVQDGQCLKCHVNATNDAGVGKTY